LSLLQLVIGKVYPETNNGKITIKLEL